MRSAINKSENTDARGLLVASVLKGSWREDLRPVDPVDIDAEALTEILPLLTMGGVAGLVWRKLRGTSAANSEAGHQLRGIYRYDALRNAVHANQLKEVIVALDEKGIESVLVKGWSLGPLYPEPGLRLFGDIDLCVRPRDFRAAGIALEGAPGSRGLVDLHCGFGKFYETRTEELFARSESRDLDGTSVGVLKFEDHFRFLCLHLLRHGGNRPLWVCDIAAALDVINDDFDWDLCLSDDPRQAELVAGAIGIASELLGANVEGFPVAERARSIPRWMISTVLSEWSVPFSLPSQVVSHLRKPLELVRELPRHWPNAIEATINLGGRLNDRPRWPLQIGDAVAKTWGLLLGSRGLTRAPI